ncbi:heparanase-like [Phymastichus coffea]|uniref:heparanase-like n=1 Tax=Phymastichus coffea TaxID=108790 RepID=UPI00273C4549|nr:heparanase-like [Phymastichus coffea]
MIIKSNSSKKPNVSFVNTTKQYYITGMSLIILSAVFLYYGYSTQIPLKHVISLKSNLSLHNIISDKFLSIGLDSSLLRHLSNVPINNKKFMNLARHLSPAFVRIGGTSADCLFFNQTSEQLEKKDNKELLVYSNDTSNFSITSNDFISLYQFTQDANLRMIFDLNVLRRNSDGSWNSDNGQEIILFAKKHGMELDWQMGNEPNSFFHVFNIRISAQQLAEDYCKLRSLLNESGYKDSSLMGPEANHIGDSGQFYAHIFLKYVKDCIDDVTWHQYYLNGHIAQLEEFLNPLTFNRLSTQIDTMNWAIKTSGQVKNMWISETSSAYGGGAPNLSDRFVASFLWLDKLGYSAKANVQVVIRQTLYGGDYAMVGHDLHPNPDWWLSVLYKKLVSERVLDLQAPDNFGKLRMYAHCASQQMAKSTDSSIVIYGVNLNTQDIRINLQIPTKEKHVYAYILTSKDLQSRDIYLNENILKLKNDGSLPKFEPKILNINDVIVLPPYSLQFFIVHQIPVAACSN